MTDPRRTADPTPPELLAAEARITLRDLAVDRVFWQRYGTSLLNAMLDAKPERT